VALKGRALRAPARMGRAVMGPLGTERRATSLLNANAFGHGGSVPERAQADAEYDPHLLKPQEPAGRDRCSDRTDPQNHHR